MNKKDLAGIRMERHIVFLILFALLLRGSHEGLSQSAVQRPSRQSAMEAFSNKEYELAYTRFMELSDLYPKDPVYKYYPGVCLVLLKREPQRAIAFLSEADKQSASMRSVPGDLLFYLGRAQQMDGRFTEAIQSYNLFIAQAGKKAAKDFKVDEYINECKSGNGRISGKELQVAESGIKVEQTLITNGPPAPEKQSVRTENAGKPVEPLPADYDRILTEAMVYHVKADSLARVAETMKGGLEKLQYQDRVAAKTRIAEIEAQEAHYRKLSDQKADNKMSQETASIVPAVTGAEDKRQTVQNPKDRSDRSGVSVVAPDTGKSQTKSGQSYQGRKSIESEEINLTVQVKKDSVKQSAGKGSVVEQVKKQPVVLSEFEINPKPAGKTGEMVPINPEQPEGLVYRIQVAVFRNRVEMSFFKGIAPAYGYRIQGTDKTTYYIGLFRRSSDAHKALESVKKKGFRDAFLVASMGGKPVSAGRAAVLEKEWGNKSLKKPEAIGQQSSSDTIPPVLTFRVEVKRSAKPLKEDVVETMRKVAGNRGFDIMETENKQVLYLIGNFITFESASEYADLLVRNGYHDAKVVAWMGKKEIPVDTARQLFEKIQ